MRQELQCLIEGHALSLVPGSLPDCFSQTGAQGGELALILVSVDAREWAVFSLDGGEGSAHSPESVLGPGQCLQGTESDETLGDTTLIPQLSKTGQRLAEGVGRAISIFQPVQRPAKVVTQTA